MKIRLFKIIIFTIIACSITLLELNASSGLNPLEWFLSKSGTSNTIQLNTDFEKKALGLEKKVIKYKSIDNKKGLQRVYKKIILNHPKASIAKEAAYNRGLYLFNKGKWESAFKAFSILKENHPDFLHLDSVIELQFQCAKNLMEQDHKGIFNFKKTSKYNTKSIPLFLDYVRLYPYDKNAPLALLNAAKISQNDNELDTAIVSLRSLINHYPESSYAAEAYFLIAHIYSEFIKGPEYDLETTREAIRYCEDFIALYPKHKDIKTIEVLHSRLLNALATNRVLLADYYYFHRRDNIAAIIFYNEAITIAPQSQAAIEAKERLDAIEIGIRPATGQNFLKKLFFIN